MVGDHLATTGNPLAQPFELRCGGRALTDDRPLAVQLAAATPRLLVMVHGICRNDRQWLHEGHDHGFALAAALGATAVYVRYNSGLHVSTNGLELARALECLARRWPVLVAEVTLLGHSMGGLVARAACHEAERAGHHWRRSLRRVVFLGTPHHGAPLERAGNALQRWIGALGPAAPLARLGRLRSAGITDLRHGSVREADWRGRDRFVAAGDPRLPLPLPENVDCFALAASLAQRPGVRRRALAGDGLVPLASALGRHRDPARDLEIPESRQGIISGDHFDLLGAGAYGQLSAWLVAPPSRGPAGGDPAPGPNPPLGKLGA